MIGFVYIQNSQYFPKFRVYSPKFLGFFPAFKNYGFFATLVFVVGLLSDRLFWTHLIPFNFPTPSTSSAIQFQMPKSQFATRWRVECIGST